MQEKEKSGEQMDGWARTRWLHLEGRRVRLFALPAPSISGEEAAASEPISLRLPLLFVHGLGCSGETWEPTLREIRRRGLGCEVYAPDMPGYGRSLGPREALGMDELADWLVCLLDALGVPRVHVVGNSMGCQVAMAMARRHPHRAGGLVLQGPTTGVRVEPPWRYAAGLLADTFHESPFYTLRLLKMYGQMGPIRYLKTVKRMLEDDPFAAIDAVRAPALVIRGGADAIVSDTVARRLAAALPDAVYLPLDAAAHAIEYNNPAEFLDAVFAFLTRAEERLDLTEERPPAAETSPSLAGGAAAAMADAFAASI